MWSYFFFSSRRRHTRWNCDWSSDVCSSDLRRRTPARRRRRRSRRPAGWSAAGWLPAVGTGLARRRPSRLGFHREIDLRHGAVRGILDLPQSSRLRLGEARDQAGWELLLLRVVLRGGVVEELTRERHLVLRRRQLFLELTDVPRGLELRVLLHHHHQPLQRARQRVLRLADLLDALGSRRVDLHRLIAGLRSEEH